MQATAYVLNEVNATLTWKEKPAEDSINVYYRVFPTKLNAKLYKLDYELVRNRFKAENALVVTNTTVKDNPFLSFGGLKTDGSFGKIGRASCRERVLMPV